jgi:hypothetical protein
MRERVHSCYHKALIVDGVGYQHDYTQYQLLAEVRSAAADAAAAACTLPNALLPRLPLLLLLLTTPSAALLDAAASSFCGGTCLQ